MILREPLEKNVIVTGAAGGIGGAVVRAFAEAGASVCALDLDAQVVESVVAQLDDPGRPVPIGFDLTAVAGRDRSPRRRP